MVDVLGCLRFRIIRRLLSFGEEGEEVDRPAFTWLITSAQGVREDISCQLPVDITRTGHPPACDEWFRSFATSILSVSISHRPQLRSITSSPPTYHINSVVASSCQSTDSIIKSHSR
jgi:hypothetical protein